MSDNTDYSRGRTFFTGILFLACGLVMSAIFGNKEDAANSDLLRDVSTSVYLQEQTGVFDNLTILAAAAFFASTFGMLFQRQGPDHMGSQRYRPSGTFPNRETVSETSDATGNMRSLKSEWKTGALPVTVTESSIKTRKHEGTLKPYPSFDAEKDCKKLKKAMSGLETDEQAITDVLGRRSGSQRSTLLSTYKKMFGKDLERKLEHALSDKFKKICLDLLESPDEFDAKKLKRALRGSGADADTLIEIMCTRTSAQIKAFTAAYKGLYERELEDDITSNTSGNFERFLMASLGTDRDENDEYDRAKARADAQTLCDAGENESESNESMFIQILCSRSHTHLRSVFNECFKLTKKQIEEVIESELTSDIKDVLISVVQCVKNPSRYFAGALQKSMRDTKTDNDALNRVVITRCEIDMIQIKEEFEKDYGQSLAQCIEDNTSGHHKEILLTLIGEGPEHFEHQNSIDNQELISVPKITDVQEVSTDASSTVNQKNFTDRLSIDYQRYSSSTNSEELSSDVDKPPEGASKR